MTEKLTKTARRRLLRDEWRGLRSDLRHNWLFLAIMTVGFIPSILSGYSMYLIILMLPWLIMSGLIRVSWNSILILAFSLTYIFPLMWYPDQPTPAQYIFIVLYPLMFYYAGIYLARRCRHRGSLLWILLICVIAYASWSIFANFEDFAVTGRIVNVMRRFEDAGEGVISATHHNMMVSLAIGCLGAVFIPTQTPLQTRLKVTSIIIGLLGLMATLHLLNRTGLVLAMASGVTGMLWAAFKSKRQRYAVFALIAIGILAVVYVVCIDESPELQMIRDGFVGRERMETYTTATAGGRVIRWMLGIDLIMANPFGSQGLFIGFRHTYAHDLWLDVGVRGGWIPMVLIVVITVRWIAGMRRFLANRECSDFARGFILLLTVALFLQMAVEPVVEGQLRLLLFFFLMMGMCRYDFGLERIPPQIRFDGRTGIGSDADTDTGEE